MRRGTVQVKKSAADDLRVCLEKSPNIAFERDAANSAAPLKRGVRPPHALHAKPLSLSCYVVFFITVKIACRELA
jgi:hypothetical protein